MGARLATTRGLLGYGLVLALAFVVVAVVVLPARPVVSDSRRLDTQRSLLALDKGAPPLVKLVDGRYFPAGTTDDQGIYVAVPLVAKVLGLKDTIPAFKWFWLVLCALTLLFLPLVLARLFGSWQAAVFGGLAAGVCIASFGNADIYWIQPLAIVALIPPLLLVREQASRGAFWILAATMIAASFASAIRSQAGVPALIVALVVGATLRGWPWGRRAVALGVVIACYLLITPLGMAGLRTWRDNWTNDPNFGKGQPTSHPFWHNTYIGLGYLPNPWKISYSDTSGDRTVNRVRPGTLYLSQPYEQTLRKLYFRAVGQHPGFVAGETVRKASVVGRHAIVYLALAFLMLPWLVIFGPHRRRARTWLLLLVPGLLITIVPPLITVPYRSYELGLYGILGLAVLLAIGEWAAPALAWLRMRDRAAAAFRHALRSSLGRRAAGITAIGLVLLAANFVIAGPIQDRANAWHAQPLRNGPLPK